MLRSLNFSFSACRQVHYCYCVVCLFSLNEAGELADNTVVITLQVNTVADIFVDEGYVSLLPLYLP